MRGTGRNRIASAAAAILLATTVRCSGGDGGSSGPPSIGYPTNPVTCTVGVAIEEHRPTNRGGASSAWQIVPALPEGLLFNPVTGAISGTPRAVSAPAVYVVQASNTAGVATAALTLCVNDVPPSDLAYAASPLAGAAANPIVPDVPSSGGGRVVSYVAAPPLPPGLVLDEATGIIAGSPTVLGASTHTITASNSGGSTSTALTISVGRPPAPTIVTQPRTVVIQPRTPAPFEVVVTGSGPLRFEWREGDRPVQLQELAPGRLPVTSRFSTPEHSDFPSDGTRFSVLVTDAYGGSALSAVALVRVEGIAATWDGNRPRSAHTATEVAPGVVLLAGGDVDRDPNVGRTAELIDARAGTERSTGALVTSRASHTATRLGSGKVLVAGGWTETAELYDPVTGSWAATGSLAAPRWGHRAILLESGDVLVLGGYATAYVESAYPPMTTAERYDPEGGVWTTAASPGPCSAAVRLQTGAVLAIGIGASGSAAPARIYDPASDTWSSTGSLTTLRTAAEALTLASGQVLAVGPDLTAELYDPAAGTWSRVRAPVPGIDGGFTATELRTGRVLVTGGAFQDVGRVMGTASTWMYDAAATTWLAGPPLSASRFSHRATRLSSGPVLITGGDALFSAADHVTYGLVDLFVESEAW